METKPTAIITKTTALSIGLVITIVAGFFFLGQLYEKVNTNRKDIDKHESILNSIPTRNEFNALKDAVQDGFSDLKMQLQQHAQQTK